MANLHRPYKWMPMRGEFTVSDDQVVFHGSAKTMEDGRKWGETGTILCNQTLSGGSIEAQLEFETRDYPAACDFILQYDSNSRATLSAGIGGGTAFAVRYSDATDTQSYAYYGHRDLIEAARPYSVRIDAYGRDLAMFVDEVEVLTTTLPRPLTASQVGLQCVSPGKITVSHFRVSRQTPRAFVVMEFSQQFDALYTNVIKPVCERLSVEAYRADDTFGPGVILQDIIQQIRDSRFVIADISPRNPNVFYELGYAHAIGKPVILLAERDTTLPFDVSGYRTLFYDDSIDGKGKVEEGLEKHIRQILAGGGSTVDAIP